MVKQDISGFYAASQLCSWGCSQRVTEVCPVRLAAPAWPKGWVVCRRAVCLAGHPRKQWAGALGHVGVPPEPAAESAARATS